ncbi:MAG: undecaprenyl-diphosphatase UppP [Chloroflexi bacterium]|nr:undecaprenyl-diphosphatase UppP [Chloroflexota bacterium]
MSVCQAIVLGIVQGLTEFLPISSSAHLTLIPWALHWPEPGLLFDTVLHVGTLAAIVAYFWHEILRILGAWFGSLRTRRIDNPDARIAWLLILGTIPAVLAGLVLEDLVEQVLGTPAIVAAILILTGVVLFVSDRLGRKDRSLEQLKAGDAIVIGVAQACAILPGLSRSGATMAGGLVRGLTRQDAARFSFLLALPITFGAAAQQIYKAAKVGLSSAEWLPMVLGALVALIAGYLAIRLLLGYVRSHSLRPFAIYCWVVGIAGLVLAWVR